MRCLSVRGFSAIATLLLVTGTLCVSGCGGSKAEEKTGSKYEAADDTGKQVANNLTSSSGQPSQPGPLKSSQHLGPVAPPQKPPAIPGEDLVKLEPEANASPQQLMEFAQTLLKRQPEASSEKELVGAAVKLYTPALKAVDKALQAKLSQEDRRQAIDLKIGAYTNLASFGSQGAHLDLRRYCMELVKDKDPVVAARGQINMFGMQISDVMTGRDNDYPKFDKQIREFIANKELKSHKGLEEQVFYLSQQAVIVLGRKKQNEMAQKLVGEIGQAFVTSKNKELAGEARNLLHQVEYAKLDFAQKQEAALRGQKNAMPEFMAAINKLLDIKEPGGFIFERIAHAAHFLEIMQNFEESRKTLDRIEKSFAGATDEDLVKAVKRIVDNGRRRMQLPGKSLLVEGVDADGQPFNWASYRGKFVLLDFWATWCRPCLEEMPRLQAMYEKYREKGVEIVGINLDDTASQGRQFLQFNKLPWKTVFSGDPTKLGLNSPMAVRCGVDALPLLILIGKDGTVLRLHIRGQELEDKLDELIAGKKAPPKKKVDTPPTQKKTSLLQPAREPFLFVTANAPQAASQKKSDKQGDAKKGKGQKKDVKKEGDEKPFDFDSINPYTADAKLKPAELVEFIFRMQDKPKSIRERPGFNEAVIDASERLMKAETKERFKTVGALTKFETLHHMASLGDEKADKTLNEFVTSMVKDKRPKIVKEVEFLVLERRLLDVDKLDLKKVPDLLKEVSTYLTKQELEARHLRIASAAVHAINRLEDGDAREKQFGEFGKMFAKSKTRELASYGKRLSKAPGGAPSQFIGKELELEGFTTLGEVFDWKAYRGKVVVVDFWATWCGPCRREMPHVRALYNELKEKGLEVVAVSLDRDLDALGRYLEENKIPWTNLAGEETQALAQKYGVRGIPTMMLIDAKGKVVDVSHGVGRLAPKARALLTEKPKPEAKK